MYEECCSNNSSVLSDFITESKSLDNGGDLLEEIDSLSENSTSLQVLQNTLNDRSTAVIK